MKKFIRLFVSFVMTVSFVSLSSTLVDASVGNYGLKPVYGDNQLGKSGFIDIYGDPGSTHTIATTVINKDTKSHKYTANVYTGYTNNSGTLSFSSNSANDPSLKIKLRNIVQPKAQTVTVPAGGMVDVKFQVQIPVQKFKGFLMGGIAVTPAKGEKTQTTVSSNGTLLKNKFVQGMGIVIRQDKNSKMQPNFKVRTVVPFANATLKQRGVKANLQNYVKGYNASIDAKATVTRRPDDHKFKKTATMSAISPAPNSNFDYMIDWGKTPLQAGDYHLRIKLVSNDKTKSWVVNKDFTISDADAAKYNKLSGIKPNYMWLWILIAILVILLVLGLGIYFGRRNQKNNN
ncbi:DUF3324 domain-containing protein [Bombilactobacillus thymidiniphilus]|uniref:DUF916 and DUF3324 domain-containing protein n=1 Tax=Bombilactobacillus thymidiniphilus TaxID=2923363 RepID=A0ABY4PBR5_9LACO|nr:DUF3324 domain-containing protein [Bombilactobacillus thymidiniphilus]UQS83210.1 DUF916 and DUF3324 domain-containing protein [Bombilactobacillus thymidiniphilus]